MAFSWTILYDQALQSRPLELLANIRLARKAILSHWDAIRSSALVADRNERHAIRMALDDLYVLGVSISRFGKDGHSWTKFKANLERCP